MEGLVTKVYKDGGSFAEVAIKRRSACVRCGACSMSAAIAKNEAGAQVGDLVDLCTESGVTLKAAFFSYGIMLVFLLAGLFIGAVIGRQTGLNADAASIFCGVAFTAGSYPVVKKFDNYFKRDKTTPKITRVRRR